MSAISTLQILPNSIPAAAGSRAARVEKAADCAGLHGEYRGEAEPRERRTPRPDRRAMSRAGTFETAPLWYGPRLRAPFVAQIIGQVLGAEQATMRQAYRGDDAKMARVVDRNA